MLFSEFALTIAGMAFPLMGVVLSWWSYRWNEEGATPDRYSDPGFGDSDFKSEMLEFGQRRRSRTCAKTAFNAGAFLLAAAVPMGAAVNHASDAINVYALSSYGVLAIAVVYAALQLRSVWLDRREHAFELYFYSDNMMQYLYNAAATRKLFFSLNPMPFWTLYDRRWYDKLRKPNVAQLTPKTPMTTGGAGQQQATLPSPEPIANRSE